MNYWDPLNQANIADPFPMYERLRTTSPILKANTGEWILSEHEDIIWVLKDSRFLAGNKLEWIRKGIGYFQNKEMDFSSIAHAIGSFILMLNPPEHTGLRKFIRESWSDRDVDELIHYNTKYLISQMNDAGEIDLVEQFARPLPSMTISGILGVPFEDFKKLQAWGFELVKLLDLYNSLKDLVIMEKASASLIDYFRTFIRSMPDEGLIARMMRDNEEKDLGITEEQLISICIMLLIAGQETTIGLIGTGLYNLERFPQVKEKVISRPELLPGLVNELLRLDGPVHLLGRIASEDVTYKQFEFKKGETITMCTASGNRDSNTFEHPDEIILKRSRKENLAFGSGIHYCLGDWLAKRQTEIAFKHFFESFPKYHIPKQPIEWNNNLSIRTLKKLNVRL
jgi:hypothetical protein